MRPRTCRPFSSSTSARIEPPSLTRVPLGPFCVMAGILRQLCLSRRQQVRLRKFGRSIGPHLIFIFAGMYQAGLLYPLPSRCGASTPHTQKFFSDIGDEISKRISRVVFLRVVTKFRTLYTCV